jgi:GNAT superfamily N-acetyltransferase
MNMYTVPERRRQGIAGLLMAELASHARSIGVRRLWLRTSSMGRSVYEKQGFAASADFLQLKL